MDYYYTDIPQNDIMIDEYILGIILSIFGALIMFFLVIIIFSLVYNYIIYKKAGRKGWEALIPIYNTIVKFEFLNIPIWMIVFLFIPAANIALSIIVGINMAKKFEKDSLFTIGLVLLPFVFYPILAFGNAKFNPNVKGIFENENKTYKEESNMGYCTNCGSKLEGMYCSNCGTKKED